MNDGDNPIVLSIIVIHIVSTTVIAKDIIQRGKSKTIKSVPYKTDKKYLKNP